MTKSFTSAGRPSEFVPLEMGWGWMRSWMPSPVVEEMGLIPVSQRRMSSV